MQNTVWSRRLVAREIKRLSHAGVGEVTALQNERLEKLVRYAADDSPFYARRYHGLRFRPERLAELQSVGKAELMAHFDEWATDRRITWASVSAFLENSEMIGDPFLGKYFVCTTSGTTGKPGVFLHDAQAWRTYVLLARVRGRRSYFSTADLGRFLWRGGRVGILAVTGGHYATAAGAEWQRRRHPWLLGRFHRTVSVMRPVTEQVRELNDFQPTVLAGYPSAMLLLAEEQRAERLRLDLSVIIIAGEWLAPASRQKLVEAFRCPVKDFYAASESLAIAFECEQGWLHVNADWVKLEPVDQDYRPVPPETSSHTVLLTNLANHIQPLIRYDLGDSITVKRDACGCGRGLQAIRVDGRRSDILTFRGRQGGEHIRVVPLALASVVEETPGMQRFQIVQVAHDGLEILLETRAGETPRAVFERASERLRRYLESLGIRGVTISLSANAPQPSPRSGKLIQVLSRVAEAATHRGARTCSPRPLSHDGAHGE